MIDTVKNIRPLPRMRTISEAIAEIREADPNTALTPWHLRQLAISGVIPRVKAGRKYLINLDLLCDYLQNPTAERFQPKAREDEAAQRIRPIY